jgi:hypothetical protein
MSKKYTESGFEALPINITGLNVVWGSGNSLLALECLTIGGSQNLSKFH